MKCPRERTILATVEPVSIKSYSRSYTRQFGHLLTNRPQAAENHPHYHLGRGYYRWFIGRDRREYENLALPPKDRLISVVSSSKRREAVLEAKKLILTRYNFWAQVIAVIEDSAAQQVSPVGGRVYGRKALRKRCLIAALEDGWLHAKAYAGFR